MKKRDIVATFSIVGYDPETEELGVAVQSKFIAVGSVVPWAKAGVGAIATQAFANPAYGPDGLDLLAQGKSPEEVVALLTEDDPDKEDRQFGIIDAKGNSASFTGEDCYDWAGGITGSNYAAQGNILVNKETVTEMGKAFEKEEGSLADRLVAALGAAQSAGGDSRGKQSAALYIVKEKGGYGGLNDVFIDLRVDDHPEPIEELYRLLQLQQLYFGETKAEDILKIEGTVKEEIIGLLFSQQYLSNKSPADKELHDALTAYIHTENFEERELEEGRIDRKVFDYMKQQPIK